MPARSKLIINSYIDIDINSGHFARIYTASAREFARIIYSYLNIYEIDLYKHISPKKN